MPRKASKKTVKTVKSTKTNSKTYSLPKNTHSYLTKIETDIKSNQSKLSMILGGLIVLVIGILVFNYFNKNTPDLGPAQQTQQEEQQTQGDVTADKLPGKYTVKEGDTLFLIAEKYYQDGEKFEEIAQANNLADVNSIVVGQVIEIPKLAQAEAMASPTSSPSEQPTSSPTPSPEASPVASEETSMPSSDEGTGGGNTTIWGPRIEGTTYTVVEGDWLSTIAARAYGDVLAYEKLAQVNNIQNPDYIVPGMVLSIPR